jgi:hypothetical protein
MIRDAKFADIHAIVSFLKMTYLRTHYAEGGDVQIDEVEAKRLLVQSIQRHGNQNGGGCWVQVSETEGVVTGLLLGTLARVYVIGDKLMASDLFWVTSPMADPRDAGNLMRSFIKWASSCPHVVEIRCGTTSIISDPEEGGSILKRIGFKDYGRIYRAETKEFTS